MSRRSAIRTLHCPLLLTAALLSGGGAAGSPQAKTKTMATAPKAGRTVDACVLLTSAELQAAVGEPLAEARSSAQPGGRIRTSQCLFRTPTFAKSVSLIVATPGVGTSTSTPREFWRNQFHPTRKKEEDTAGEPAELPSASDVELERDARKPRAVFGLGDEAFWVGSPISGALYVLQGDAFLRVSVGGIPEESSRLAKSKMAASAAIARLGSMLSGNEPSSPK
jgi:hypothetical protein